MWGKRAAKQARRAKGEGPFQKKPNAVRFGTLLRAAAYRSIHIGDVGQRAHIGRSCVNMSSIYIYIYIQIWA